jgi:hypothetical protein
VKNASDACPYVSSVWTATADEDGDGIDAGCDFDDRDPRVGNRKFKVFVDGTRGSDTNSGVVGKPVKSISKAIALARARGWPVYVAAGTYGAADFQLLSGVELFGGFKNSSNESERFSSRDVRSEDVSFKTLIVRDDAPTTLFVSCDAAIDGFYIENAYDFESGGSDCSSETVVVSGGEVVLDGNSIVGNSDSCDSMALRISGGSVILNANFIFGGGFDSFGSESTGANFEGGGIKASNNVISGGGARFSTALKLAAESAIVTNNTIFAASGNEEQGFSRGIVIEASGFMLANNIIYTAGADDELPVMCNAKNISGNSLFEKNALANFSDGSFRPVAFGCDGKFSSAGNFNLGGALVSGNVVFSGTGASGLIDELYSPAAGILIDSGADASGEIYGGVHFDFYGETRFRGTAFDIGAVEK